MVSQGNHVPTGYVPSVSSRSMYLAGRTVLLPDMSATTTKTQPATTTVECGHIGCTDPGTEAWVFGIKLCWMHRLLASVGRAA